MTIWRLRDRELDFGPPLAAGIVNVTDDSFYSAARSGTPERAARDGLALLDAGFDLLDVGALAARSGPPVDPADEAGRLVPAVAALVRDGGAPVLADTFSPEVAARALDAGAAAINDIGGGAAEMLELVAERECGYVLMHIEGPPRVDRTPADHADVVGELVEWFGERLADARARGVAEERIALDPGFDFDLTTDDDIALLRGLDELRALGRPLYVALSRKDFLGAIAAGSWEDRLAAEERGPATMAATALAVAQGADILRLHDVESLDALRTAAAIVGAAPGPGA